MTRSALRSRRLRLSITTALVLAVPACSSESDPEGSPPSSSPATGPTEPTEPAATGPATDEPFGNRASRRCTELINELDASIGEAARDASIEVLYAATKDIVPTDDELTGWADAMRARVEQLQPLIDALGELDDVPDTEAWQIVLDSGTAEIDHYNSRIAVTEVDDWAEAGNELVVGGSPDERLVPAFETLGLTRRDCEGVFTHPGNPAEFEQFLDFASETCSTIVSRRSVSGVDEGTDIVFGALEEVIEDEPVTVSPELADAVDLWIAEWTATLADLENVPTADVPDEAEWQVTLDWAQDRLDGFIARAAALESGDQDELVRVFTPGETLNVAGPGDWGALALDRRDCRAILG